jgi:hypothetical protein
MKLRGGVLFITASLAVLAVAPMAHATNRFVSPSGGGAATCTSGDPCSLKHALEDVAVAGDDVLLDTSASYTVSSDIVLSKDDVFVYGPTDTVVMNIAAGVSLRIDGQGDGIFDARITGSGGSIAPLQFSPYADGSVGSNLDVENLGGSVGALRSESSIQLTDSLFVSDAAGVPTVLAGDGSFLNVTSIAIGSGTAITATDSLQGGGRVFVLNSILQSSGLNNDAAASGSHAHLGLYKSNLDHSDPGLGTIDTDPGVPNQGAPASLTGTYREVLGSPTIDAGYSDDSYPFEGQADLDFGFRCMGAAVDIGADEYDAGDVCAGFSDTGSGGPSLDYFDFTAPVVSRFKALKKGRKVTGFTFASSEPGFATLSYQRKKGKKYKSAGTQRKIAVAGANVVKRKKLKKGSYRVTLRILDSAGNESSAKKLTFKVK